MVGRLPRARPEPRLVPKELGSVAAAGALEVAGDGAAESACEGVTLDMVGSDMTGFIMFGLRRKNRRGAECAVGAMGGARTLNAGSTPSNIG